NIVAVQPCELCLAFTAVCWSFTHKHTHKQSQIPIYRKLCYAVGGIPNRMTNISIDFTLQIFLLDVVKMEAFFVSLILLVSQTWDAVIDPLVGYLVSRSGRLLPWVVLSTPLGIMSYVFLWFTPQDFASVTFCILWHLITSCLFETFMSLYNVPYISLNMFLGGDERDRDSATAYSKTRLLYMVAMLLGSLLQGQVISVYNTERDAACLDIDLNHGNTQSGQTSDNITLINTRNAFKVSGMAIGGIYFLCSLVLFLGVKEEPGLLRSQEHTNVPYFSSMKKLMKHVPYVRLVLGFFFCTLSFQMSLRNFALYCTYAAGLGVQFPYLILVLLVSATLSVPLWQVVLVRMGKRTTVFIGLPIFMPVLIVIASVPGSLPVYMAMCILCGSSLGTLFLLPWSMLPDVVDDFAVKNPSCKHLEPLFFSSYTFFNKLGGGLSAGISTLVLHFTGYRAGACHHEDRMVTALQVLFVPVPIVLLLLGLVFFYLYPIQEKELRSKAKDCPLLQNLKLDGRPLRPRSQWSSSRSHRSTPSFQNSHPNVYAPTVSMQERTENPRLCSYNTSEEFHLLSSDACTRNAKVTWV
uniref:Uncharacterized protein n=1 Tax=Denticeps clupeoides TaxID=299321 RepID=A0AAY4EFH7_9TELE